MVVMKTIFGYLWYIYGSNLELVNIHTQLKSVFCVAIIIAKEAVYRLNFQYISRLFFNATVGLRRF